MSERSLNSKIIQHPEVKKAMDKYKNAKKNNKKDKIKYNKTKRRVSQLENESRLLWSESDEDRYDEIMHQLKMKRRNLNMEKQDMNRTSDILKKSKKQLNTITKKEKRRLKTGSTAVGDMGKFLRTELRAGKKKSKHRRSKRRRSKRKSKKKK
tara:strand:- start:2200 stop:2658 length:459 start_codon:yes stop_codon:yes gene_type:complete